MRVFFRAETEARCFTGESPVAPQLHRNATRGAFAEALLLRDFSAVGVRRGRRMARIVDLSRPAAAAGPAAAHAEVYLRLAECTVELDPAGAFALFATAVASPEEDAAVRALVPGMAECLPPGLEVPMRAEILRSWLAEGAYRVSVRRQAAPR